MAKLITTPADDDPGAGGRRASADPAPVESPSAEFVTGAEPPSTAEPSSIAVPSSTGEAPDPGATKAEQSATAVAADPAPSATERSDTASPRRPSPSDEPAAPAEVPADSVATDILSVAARPAVADHDTSPQADSLSPVAEQQVLTTSTAAPIEAATEPPAPRRRSNRLFATGMVLLSALLFEALYLAAFALLVSVLSGPQQVVPGLQSLIAERLIWVPLVLFVVLYELLVLLFNRAGRFVYVVASLVVGFLVFVGSIVVVVPLVTGQPVTQDILRQVLVGPEFVLAGLAAREVMLWTGFAIGAHGKRLRRKNREARDEYEHELAEAA